MHEQDISRKLKENEAKNGSARARSRRVLPYSANCSTLISESTRTASVADKKREGRCPGDYFFFTVYVRHFSGFNEALDSKGILYTLKKVLRQPQNVLTL